MIFDAIIFVRRLIYTSQINGILSCHIEVFSQMLVYIGIYDVNLDVEMI